MDGARSLADDVMRRGMVKRCGENGDGERVRGGWCLCEARREVKLRQARLLLMFIATLGSTYVSCTDPVP